MNLKTIVLGINNHTTMEIPKPSLPILGSSDAYINYQRGHYTKEQIEAVYDLEPRFYMLDNLTIVNTVAKNEDSLTFTEELPVLFTQCSTNYLHFLFENMGRILFLKEKGISFKPIIGVPIWGKGDKHYFDTDKYKFLNDPFAKIGLNFEEVLISHHDYKTITFPKLITTHLEYLVHFEGYSVASRLLRNYLREPGKPRQNIYISRRYSVNNNPRYIHDEENIEKYYERRGYKIVYNERLTFTEQINLYKNAKHIVGISGTGLVNILFAPDDCKLTELRTSDYKDDEVFRYICKYLGNDYELITSYDSNGSAGRVLDSIKGTPGRT